MLPVDQHLCFALYSANHAMAALYKRLLDPLRLTYPQYLVLLVLWETDGQTVGTLGDRLMLESNTLTPLLKRMEAAGIVTRERSKIDERQVIIRLTGHGQDLREQAAHIPACIARGADLDLPQLAALQQTIRQLGTQLRDAAARD